MNYCECDLIPLDSVRKITGLQFDFSDYSLQSATISANNDLIDLIGDCFGELCVAKDANTLTPEQEDLIDKIEPIFAWTVYINRLENTVRVTENKIEHQFLSDNLEQENKNNAKNINKASAEIDKAMKRLKLFIKEFHLNYPCLPTDFLSSCGCEVLTNKAGYYPIDLGITTWDTRRDFFKKSH